MEEAIGKTDGNHEEKLEKSAQDIIRDGHPAKPDGNQDRMKNGGKEGRDDSTLELDKTGIAPQASIQAEEPEYQNAERSVGKDEAGIRIPILRGNLSEAAVKAQPQRDGIGGNNDSIIVDHQKEADDLPMFKQRTLIVRFHTRLLPSYNKRQRVFSEKMYENQ